MFPVNIAAKLWPRIIVATLCVVLAVSSFIPNATLTQPAAAAGGGHSQFSFTTGDFTYHYNGFPGDTQTMSIPMVVEYFEVSGYNQNNDYVTWKRPICDAAREVAIFGWWWDMSRGVTIRWRGMQKTIYRPKGKLWTNVRVTAYNPFPGDPTYLNYSWFVRESGSSW